MVLRLLTFLFLFIFCSSCLQDIYSISTSRQVSNSAPKKLRITGPATLISLVCSQAITVSRLDGKNRLSLYSQATTVTLDPAVAGSFHLLNDCSDGAITSVDIDAGQSSKIIYYKNSGTTNVTVTASGLTESGLLNIGMLANIPEFTLSRDVFTIDENGDAIGTEVTITRSTPGLAQTIAVDIEGITATGTDLSLPAPTISFAPADVSKTVTFTMANPSGFKGDRFFRFKISSPSGPGVLGTITESIVNLLDNEISPGKFFFSQPLYTVNENAGSVSILIQRSGDLSIAETINLTTINGTATGNAIGVPDFRNTTQTFLFAINESEKVVTIPVTDNAIQGDNRSFFIELKNPVEGPLITRPWSTSKVRIMDNDDLTICDENQNDYGGGSGIPSDPYLICSLNHMGYIASHLTNSYKVMRDLDLSGFAKIAGSFSGTFNGNEHVLKKFTTSGASASALFNQVGGNAGVEIVGINLMEVSISSTGGGNHVAGLTNTATNNFLSFSNNLVSGMITAVGSRASGLIGEVQSAHVASHSNNLIHGKISGASHTAGMIAIAVNQYASVKIEKSYSTATLIGEDQIGGFVARMQNAADGAFVVHHSHAKGYLYGYNIGNVGTYASHIGGVAGSIDNQNNSPVDISNFQYEGKIFGARRTAGLVGELSSYTTGAAYSFSNNFVQAEIRGSNSAGGLIGRISGNYGMSFIGNRSSATLIADEDTIIGGLIGYFVQTDGLIEIKNSELTALSSITSAYSGMVGGLVADMTVYGTPQIEIENIINRGDINTPLTNQSGGILGNFYHNAITSAKLLLRNVHMYGDISARRNIGGLIGTAAIGSGILGDNTSLTIDSSSHTGNVTSGDSTAGGIIGNTVIGDYTTLLIMDSFSTGNISALWSAGGIIGAPTYEAREGTDSSITILRSYSTGNVTVVNSLAGGLLGEVTCRHFGEILIDESFSLGDISGTDNLGGLVAGFQLSYVAADAWNPTDSEGKCVAEIRNSYFNGNISAAPGKWAGGFAAFYMYDGNIATLKFTNSYSAALFDLPAENEVDGFAYKWEMAQPPFPAPPVVYPPATIQDSFFKTEPGFNDGLQGVSPRTGLQLATQGTFTNWGFGTIWEIKAPGLYPTLLTNPEP